MTQEPQFQFSWAKVMATGKGLFHDFPIAIGKTAITFNRFGIVPIANIQWVSWTVGPKSAKWQRYAKPIKQPDFAALNKWPVMLQLAEPTYKDEELKKIRWENSNRREKQRARRANGKRKKLIKTQERILAKAIEAAKESAI